MRLLPHGYEICLKVSQTQATQPGDDVGFGMFHHVSGYGKAVSDDGSPWLEGSNGLDSIGKTASAMRIERYHRFPGKVALFEEGIENHRHIGIPVGITEKNDVIFLQFRYASRYGWASAFPLFVLGPAQ